MNTLIRKLKFTATKGTWVDVVTECGGRRGEWRIDVATIAPEDPHLAAAKETLITEDILQLLSDIVPEVGLVLEVLPRDVKAVVVV